MFFFFGFGGLLYVKGPFTEKLALQLNFQLFLKAESEQSFTSLHSEAYICVNSSLFFKSLY